MKSLIITALAVFGLMCGSLAEPRRFNVGDEVEMLYASAWYPGEVVAIAPGGLDGAYTVQDPQGENHDYHWRRLRLAGQDLTAPGDLEAGSTYGLWGVGAAGQVAFDADDKIGTEYWGASQGALTINADGTFVWGSDPASALNGIWEHNPKPDANYGPVKILNGLFGHTWWATYTGKDDAGQSMLYLRSDYGTSATGFRW